MAWITLSLRKQSLKTQASELEMQDISLSREKRSIQRNLAYQKSIVEAEESAELYKVKQEYKAVKNKRPMQVTIDGTTYYFKTKADYEKWRENHSNSSDKPADGTTGLIGSYNPDDEDGDTKAKEKYNELYSEWKDNKYEAAKEAYEEQATYIKDMADDEKEELEEEATDKESQLEEEQTIVETNLQDINQELSSITEQISSDVQNSAIKFR